MFSGGRESVHWERMGSNIYLINISNIYKSEVLGRFSMYYRFLMYALVSPETFLIFLSYCLNLSQFCLKFVWSCNYLIKKKYFSNCCYLITLVLLPDFFWFWCSWQSSDSYHSERKTQSDEIHHTCRHSTSMTLFLVLLLQFKVILSSDKYKKISLHHFYQNPCFLRLTHGFGQKDKKHAKNLES